MRTSEQIDKIAPAIVAASGECRLVKHTARNQFDNYNYAQLKSYVMATSDALNKHGLFVSASIQRCEAIAGRKTKSGNEENAVRVYGVMRATHTSGQYIEIDVIGEGQDRADKAVYKAITGARKYGYAQLFGMATSDDPEADESVGTDEPPPPQRQTPKREATAKDRAVSVITEWSGVTKEDVKAAVLNSIQRCGIQVNGKQLTDDQWNVIASRVDEAKASGVAWSVWVETKQ